MDGVKRIECTVYTEELPGTERAEIVSFIHDLIDAVEGEYPTARVTIKEVQTEGASASDAPRVELDCDGDGVPICSHVEVIIKKTLETHFGRRQDLFAA